MKKKKNSTKTLGKFSTIFMVVVVAMLFYVHQDGKPLVSTWVSELFPVSENNSVDTDIAIDGLEIPVSTRERNEIKLRRTGYTVSYNNFYKTPNWVAWELTRTETTGTETRKSKFLPDPDLPEPRVDHDDYTHSGYDRGHMAPAADMKWSEKAMEESFYMSNICPQNQKLNRDDWKDLEDQCREWAKQYGRVYIACGPIYDQESPKRIGVHQVAVPNRFFKVVLVYESKKPVAMGFLFENKAHHQSLQKYVVSVDHVEEETGLDFFSLLPDSVENYIESQITFLNAKGKGM